MFVSIFIVKFKVQCDMFASDSCTSFVSFFVKQWQSLSHGVLFACFTEKSISNFQQKLERPLSKMRW